MTVSEFMSKIDGKYNVSEVIHQDKYLFKLGKRGVVTLQYSNGEFQKLIVDGIEKKKIEKFLKNCEK